MNAYDKAWPIFAIVREHRHKKLYGRRDGLVDWERKAVRLRGLYQYHLLRADPKYIASHHRQTATPGNCLKPHRCHRRILTPGTRQPPLYLGPYTKATRTGQSAPQVQAQQALLNIHKSTRFVVYPWSRPPPSLLRLLAPSITAQPGLARAGRASTGTVAKPCRLPRRPCSH